MLPHRLADPPLIGFPAVNSLPQILDLECETTVIPSFIMEQQLHLSVECWVVLGLESECNDRPSSQTHCTPTYQTMMLQQRPVDFSSVSACRRLNTLSLAFAYPVLSCSACINQAVTVHVHVHAHHHHPTK